MKVTIIDSDVSYPMTSGKRLRTLNLLLPLARRHQLTYIGRSEGPTHSRAASTFLGDHGITPILIEAPLQTKRGAGFYINLARNLVSPLPYSAASHIKPAMRAAAVEHAALAPVDLWQIEWSGYGYCVENLPGPVVLQAHNVDALIWKRYYEAEANPAKRLFIRDQWQKFERFERTVFRSVDKVVAVSTADAALAETSYGALPIDVVDNGVDVAGFAGISPALQSNTILFLGALDWRPNIDAADQLLDHIFPALRALQPQARLTIVGRHPSEALRRRVAEEAGVELHADVPDVKPFLAASAAMAVPLRVGGGSRLKILEALAAGLPVVSTAVGAEGLEIEPGAHYVRADTAQDMAIALAGALTDPVHHCRQAEAGRKAVAQRYDWTMLAAKLEGIWEQCVRDQRRR